MSDLFKDRERLAVRYANLAGYRWNEIDDSIKRYYLKEADRQIYWHEQTKGQDEPRLMPPFTWF